MKFVARVTRVNVAGIHFFGSSEAAPPEFVEVHPDDASNPESPAMLYRYRRDGTFCGDTWHETVQYAFEQAQFEYGIDAHEWVKEE